MRLSPLGKFNDMGDGYPEVTSVNHRDAQIGSLRSRLLLIE